MTIADFVHTYNWSLRRRGGKVVEKKERKEGKKTNKLKGKIVNSFQI